MNAADGAATRGAAHDADVLQDARDVLRLAAERDLADVRVVFVDQHGLTRGRSVGIDQLGAVLRDGIGVPGSLLHKDTGNTYALPLWEPTGDAALDALVGARNIVLRPDPRTFRVLPWAKRSGWLLCDIETVDGAPLPHSTRDLCRRALDRLAGHDLRFRAGLELELYVYRRAADGTLVPVHAGWDLLGEAAYDEMEPLLAPIRAGLAELGLAPRTLEAELGPGQVELTFGAVTGLEVADQAVLVRNAVRSIARRHGLHATFMCRPALGDSFPSGWHLHQSLTALGGDGDGGRDGDGSLFEPRPAAASDLLSPLGQQWVAGLLEHAAASCLLSTPTVNGYKRYRARAVAPDRITWSREHRGAMLRVVGAPGDAATRVENRVGDPSANPYLFVASQVLSGLDGLERSLVPPPPSESPYSEAGGPLLPRSLGEAIEAFESSGFYRDALGADVHAYLVALKRSEWGRFLAAVTDWEQREYFEQF